MKKIKAILLCCISSLLFFSCIKEDMSDCPPQVNVQLTFSYIGDTGEPSMFARCIDYVTLMVYNANERLVLNRNIYKNELMKLQGAELYLEPGDYRIICWGNSHEYTQFIQCESFAEGRLQYPSLTDGIKIPTNSHLYYGSYEIKVPGHGMTEGDIPFYGAHINIEVYVRGMSSIDTYDKWPLIEAHNLMPQYNMEMTATKPYSTTYYPETTYNRERNVNQALFQVLRFNDNNPVSVEIKNQAGESLCTVGLKEYMIANKISVNGKNEATIPILIELSELGVEVKVPEWIVNEVSPE